MVFNHLPDLLNTGFTIVEIVLFYGGENLEAKICRFQALFGQHGHVYRGRRRVKTLQMSSIFIKTLNLLPKALRMNSKQGNLLNFFHDLSNFIEYFATCS